jgi:plasmid replication initiation protein
MNIVLVDKENEIKKSEALVKSRYKLKPLALKLVTTLISSVQSNDFKNQEYCISAKNFANVSELKGRSYYDNLKMACIDIMSKPITIGKKGTKDYLVCNWVSSCEYRDDENIIVFQISPKLFPYILDIKEKFLKYDLSNILPLKSDYSIRVYEWLKDEYNKHKRYNRSAEVVYEVDYLRDRFEIPKSYQWNDIKKRILDKAKKDLLEKCDIKFDWEVTAKIGKKTSHIKFKIYPNIENIKENIKLPPYLDNFMSYVSYLRDKYKGTFKYFFLSNFELGGKKKVYYFGINNKNLMYATPSSGGDAVQLTKERSELIYNASYLCSLHSEIYRELISDIQNFWELAKDNENKEFFGVVDNEIISVLKKFDPRHKPLF